MGKVALIEVFQSCQGEGYNAGRDAIFVRFAGCNLSCVFADNAICDTPYQHAQLKLEFGELCETIRQMRGRATRNPSREHETMLILTGGEPTLQPYFDDLIKWAFKHDFYIAVETNGTRWRDALRMVDWISCSPKEDVQQGSPSPNHNPNPQSTVLEGLVVEEMASNAEVRHEYRYVISAQSPPPEYLSAYRHYLSPAVNSDGTGQEWKKGFPGFAPRALENCLQIVKQDPRWRISIQQHKIMGVR